MPALKKSKAPKKLLVIIFSISDMGSRMVDTQSSNAVNVFTQNICPGGSVYLRIIPLTSDSK